MKHFLLMIALVMLATFSLSVPATLASDDYSINPFEIKIDQVRNDSSNTFVVPKDRNFITVTVPGRVTSWTCRGVQNPTSKPYVYQMQMKDSDLSNYGSPAGTRTTLVFPVTPKTLDGASVTLTSTELDGRTPAAKPYKFFFLVMPDETKQSNTED